MNCLYALLSIGIVLQLDKDTRELSLGLIVIWLGIMFTRALWTAGQDKDAKSTTLLYGTALGLTLIQARTITQRDDEHGVTQYLLIAAGLLSVASLNTKEARLLLQWLGLTTIIISILILIPLLRDYSFSQRGFAAMYEAVFRDGLGDENSMRIVLSILSATTIAAARLSRSLFMTISMLGGAALGYIAIVATDSRMAMVAPIIGCILA